MSNKTLNRFERKILIMGTKWRWLFIVISLLLLPIIYIVVYFTGGTQYVYPHLIYIPIVLVGVTAGYKWGLFTGLVSGIILGPLMPLKTDTNPLVMQDATNWFFRMLIYILIGLFSGYVAYLLKKKSEEIADMFSHNLETKIPNTNIFIELKDKINEPGKYNIITILINNHDNIVDLLGVDIYHRLLSIVYRRLKTNLALSSIIVQSDNNKIWIAKLINDQEMDAKYILSILQEPLNIDDIPLYVEFSLGITQAGNYEECLSFNIYRNSDIAARYAQKNNISYALYDEDLILRRGEFELLGLFSKALEDYQTKLVYQPKFDLKTNKVIGLEALIRWEHPKYGLINPGSFIPLIEGTQLIHLLTEWVIKEVVKKIKDLLKENIVLPISLNVSAKNFFDPNFSTKVLNAIKGVPPKLIEIEITETVLMSNPEESKIVLNSFKEQEITVSLDDFGKGYSSLSYLSQFPIQVVKIDQYFSEQLASDHSTQLIVKSTIDLAHNLGYKVLAEGVEKADTLKIYQEFGCDFVQGFYFERPIKDNEIISWLKKNK